MIKRDVRSVPVIMMTAYRTTEVIVQAMRLGAADFLEKPLTLDDLLQAVRVALAGERGVGPERADLPTSHAAARWADAVCKAIDAPQDPRTLDLWGRHIGASSGSLRNWCRMAGLSPKRSLSVARMLRAINYSSTLKPPEDVFNVTDRRTLRQLLTLGDPNRLPSVPGTIDEFVESQRWISSPSAIQELKRLLLARLRVAPDDDRRLTIACDGGFMRRIGLAGLIGAGIMLGSSTAGAQERGQFGLVMGYPTAVGAAWHTTDRVAIKAEATFSVTSSELDSGPLLPERAI